MTFFEKNIDMGEMEGSYTKQEEDEDKVIDRLLAEEDEKADSAAFDSFEQQDTTKKLEQLEKLVKQSQVYSSIIAENLLESTRNKSIETDQEPAIKKRKLRTNSQRKAEEGPAVEFEQPKLISGATMKGYQLEGLEWLASLYQNGLNGILADEMGLGKTLQSISLLAFLCENGIKGPFLVAAPLSTVGNWVNEFEKFAPEIPALRYAGLKEDRRAIRAKHFDSKKHGLREAFVVVTSYEIVLKDLKHLNRINWNYLIVDEGHRLKNINCKLITSLKKLNTSNRLLLTGTPLQNNLNELWSLLNFILPDIFHDLDLFQKWFDFSSLSSLSNDSDDATKKMIDAKIQETLVNNLHQIMKPFILRRLKRNVIKNLPPKREYIVYSKLTEQQSKLYTKALERSLKSAVYTFAFHEHLAANDLKYPLKEVERFLSKCLEPQQTSVLTGNKKYSYQSSSDSPTSSGFDGEGDFKFGKKLREIWSYISPWIEKKAMQNLMMQLRLVCGSPYLFYFPWESEEFIHLSRLIESSAKLQILDQLLPRLIKKKYGKHKVLIFSQFTKMLDLIQDYCELKGVEVSRLDGGVSQDDREVEIDKFNNANGDSGNVCVFLLSTRAGGLGLNLTAADSVIIFDSDWNPQVDLQAMDRVHRIGQEKPVIIYRFITLNTIEQVLLAKADSKRKLEKMVIQLGKFESLKTLMKQDSLTNSALGFGTNRTKKESESILAAELRSLYEDDQFKFTSHEFKDNTLTEKELQELTDRSLEAYSRDTDYYEQFEHVQIFETTASMDSA